VILELVKANPNFAIPVWQHIYVLKLFELASLVTLLILSYASKEKRKRNNSQQNKKANLKKSITMFPGLI